MANMLSSIRSIIPTTATTLFPLSGSVSSFVDGLPRGSITEIVGRQSAGCTSLAQSLLAASLARGETCAVIDWADGFDPLTAVYNGLLLERLLWVRCNHKPERAFKAIDVLLHVGGFGVVVLDLQDVEASTLRRIPLSWWYRCRKAIEHSPTILLVIGDQQVTGSCASCIIGVSYQKTRWSGSPRVPVLEGIDLEGSLRKPMRAEPISFSADLTG